MLVYQRVYIYIYIYPIYHPIRSTINHHEYPILGNLYLGKGPFTTEAFSPEAWNHS